MPYAYIPLESVHHTSITQSIYKIALDLIKIHKLDNVFNDRLIMYNGEEVTLTDGRINTKGRRADNLPLTTATRKFILDITDNIAEDHLTSSVTRHREYYPIFQDTSIDFEIRPIYTQTEYKLRFTIITPSYSEAKKIQDDIKHNIAMHRSMNLHDIEYCYIIPEVIEDLIADIYDKLRYVDKAPSLQEYFTTHSTKRFNIQSDLAGNNKRLAICEKQVRIVGRYDFQPLPEKPEKDNGVYRLTIDYTLTFERPSHLIALYPLVVCNQIMDSKYIDYLIGYKDKLDKNRDYTAHYSMGDLHAFESQMKLDKLFDLDLPYNLPMEDIYRKRTLHKGYGLVLSILGLIDDNTHKLNISLDEIEDISFDKTMLEYMSLEKDYITKPYASFIYAGITDDKQYFDYNGLKFDGIRFESEVMLRLCRQNRITISYIYDITMLLDNAIYRLYCYDCRIVVSVISNFLYMHRNMFDMLDNKAYNKTLLILLRIIINMLDRECVDHLKSLLYSMKMITERVYFEILSIAKNSFYQEIYKRLYNVVDPKDFSIADKHKYRDFYKHEYTGMKTVMNFFVEARRTEE